MVYLRKLMSNAFFLKYFTINYILNFLYVICNKNPSMKNFFLQELNNKTNSKNSMINCNAINCTRKLTCVCAYACACDYTRLREQ